MNEEENQAFKVLRFYNSEDYGTEELKKYIKVIENLVEKQQKEIENRLNEIKCLYNFISIREERIDELVEINEKYNDLYISKDKIKELREIDNIDLIQFKLKELLGE